MVDKPIPPDADDQDSWENLAKDLFGVEFDPPSVSPDDLDDELLTDDFLKDEEEQPESAESAEPELSAETPEFVAEETTEAAAISFSQEDQGAEIRRPQREDDNLDALLDFSQPFGEEDDDFEVDDDFEAGEEFESSPVGEPGPKPVPNLFERLAAEENDFDEDDDFDDDFDELEDDLDDELEDELDDELEDEMEEVEASDEQLELDEESDDQLDTDDFWDVLEKFAPEELGTPHIDHGQTRGGKPPRDPEIGLVADAPQNEVRGSASFETEFESDSDFGLGVLDDVEIDDDDEDDVEEAESAGTGTLSEDGEEETKPRRRRRRRRRGGRRKKPATDRTEESGVSDESVAPAAVESLPVSEADDFGDDDEDLSDRESDDDLEISRASGSSRYKNIPTWTEAIDLIVDRRPRSSSENRGQRGSRNDTRNRKRGGRRRRPRKSSS